MEREFGIGVNLLVERKQRVGFGGKLLVDLRDIVLAPVFLRFIKPNNLITQ